MFTENEFPLVEVNLDNKMGESQFNKIVHNCIKSLNKINVYND